MADLSTKKNPLHLREEKPDYARDESDAGGPTNQPDIATDPMALPTEGRHKPAVHLDEEKVREHEKEKSTDRT